MHAQHELAVVRVEAGDAAFDRRARGFEARAAQLDPRFDRFDAVHVVLQARAHQQRAGLRENRGDVRVPICFHFGDGQ